MTEATNLPVCAHGKYVKILNRVHRISGKISKKKKAGTLPPKKAPSAINPSLYKSGFLREIGGPRIFQEIFYLLDGHFGGLNWWPGESRVEIITGAILIQNTAWKNVVKALENLKKSGCLTFRGLEKTPEFRIEQLIRPSGYFRQKTLYLKNFIRFTRKFYGGSLKKMANQKTLVLRRQLLTVGGIGPETADSILLYAFQKPIFVVDAYTRRIFGRLGLLEARETYNEIQRKFESSLKKKASFFNQFHALIVSLGKDFCRPQNPNCAQCPLERLERCRIA